MTTPDAQIAWVGKRTRGQTARFPEVLAEPGRTDALTGLALQTTYTEPLVTSGRLEAVSVSVWVSQEAYIVLEASPDGDVWQKVSETFDHPAQTRLTKTHLVPAHSLRVGIYPDVAGAEAVVLWQPAAGSRI